MLSRQTPDLILDSTRSTTPSSLSRWTPDLIASMLSQGDLLQYARFYFLQPNYRCLPWLAWHGWWSCLTLSSSWWACCDDFLLFCVVGLEKKWQRNTRKTFQEEIQPAELLQFIFCAGFNQSSTNKHHHKEQWYYEFPITYASLGFNQSSTRSPQGTMVLWIPNNVRKSLTRRSTRTSGTKTTKNIGTGSQHM